MTTTPTRPAINAVPQVEPYCVPEASQLGRLVRARVFSQLTTGDRVFILREPIVVRAERDGGLWVHQCDDLGLLSYGPTEDVSSDEFANEFAFTWDGLMDEPNSALTVDAQQLKARLRGLVEDIETF